LLPQLATCHPILRLGVRFLIVPAFLIAVYAQHQPSAILFQDHLAFLYRRQPVTGDLLPNNDDRFCDNRQRRLVQKQGPAQIELRGGACTTDVDTVALGGLAYRDRGGA
jgi:hypothetical protein